MTLNAALSDSSTVVLTNAGPAAVTAATVDAYPVKDIWVTADAVRAQPRVYK